MDTKALIEYIQTWAEMHTQEVYGSPREYIQIYELKSELRNLAERAGD